MTIKRVAKKPRPGVRAWESKLRLARTSNHLRKISDQDIIHFAALLTLIGSPTDADARNDFQLLRAFLWQPQRLTRFRRALQKIPPRKEAVQKVAQALRDFGLITSVSITRGRLQTDQVIEVILQVPDCRAYIEHLHKKGFDHLGGIFHPNTLKHQAKELRGVFSETEAYWEATEDQLNIIRDD